MQELCLQSIGFFSQAWHQLVTALAHNRNKTYQTNRSCLETALHLIPTESNMDGQFFVGWSWPFEVSFHTEAFPVNMFQDLFPCCSIPFAEPLKRFQTLDRQPPKTEFGSFSRHWSVWFWPVKSFKVCSFLLFNFTRIFCKCPQGKPHMADKELRILFIFAKHFR